MIEIHNIYPWVREKRIKREKCSWDVQQVEFLVSRNGPKVTNLRHSRPASKLKRHR